MRTPAAAATQRPTPSLANFQDARRAHHR
jgi:hypothetical protein